MTPLGLVLFLRHLPLQAIQPVVRLLGGRFDRCQPGNDLHMPLVLFLLLALDIIYTGFMANLLNQSMFLLGIPGSGKSFFAKLLIIFLALATNDDIIICDPEGEYTPLIQAIGKQNASVIRIAAGGRDRINAMDMVEGYGDNNPIVDKAQFIMSLIEQIDPSGVGAHHKSIIDRCTDAVYKEQAQTCKVPTLYLA